MRTPDQTRQTTGPRRAAGAAAVEFAIVLTVLMLILAGTVEIGRALWYYDALAKGTRDAARYLSMVSVDELNGKLADARSIALASGTEARVPDLVVGQVTARCDTPASANCSSIAAGTVFNVTVSVAYPMTIGGWIPFVPSGDGDATGFAVTLQPHTTMRHMW